MTGGLDPELEVCVDPACPRTGYHTVASHQHPICTDPGCKGIAPHTEADHPEPPVDRLHELQGKVTTARAHMHVLCEKWAAAYPDWTANRTEADDALYVAILGYQQANQDLIAYQRGEG